MTTAAEVLAGRRSWAIERGHVLELLRALPAESVQCVVTSPPYWGLRVYGTEPQVWGGDPDCGHEETAAASAPAQSGGTGAASAKQVTNVGSQYGNHEWKSERYFDENHRGESAGIARYRWESGDDGAERDRWRESTICLRCGAWLGELGGEPTPELFIAHLVGVFREVRRVLRRDGVAWVNLGDSYAGSGKGPDGKTGFMNHTRRQGFVGTGKTSHKDAPPGLKPKDLIGVPWMAAFALRADGWYLRQDCIWHKPNPMPESVGDRPTRAHEYVFLLSKSGRYYYDAAAIAEPVTGNAHARGNGVNPKARHDGYAPGQTSANMARLQRAKVPSGWDTGPGDHRDRVGRYPRVKQNESFSAAVAGLVDRRNRRSVWTIPTAPYPEAHFATFPPEIPRLGILAGSREGDVVLDPFSGSGTTVMVATRLGRRGIGLELNPEYAAMSERRIRDDAPLFNTQEETA